MSFHEVRFPTSLSFGSIGGPERRVEIVTLANGFEERNSPWAHSRRRYDAGLGMRSLDDVSTLVDFFEARQGQLYGFRWKDWSDFKSCLSSATPACNDQFIGNGDGATTMFRLTKAYSSGSATYIRPIHKPVAGSVHVDLDGTELAEGADFTVDPTSGTVTLTTPPGNGAEIRAGFEFDVPVRFDIDRIATSVKSFNAGDVPNVPVVEVRL